MSVAQPPAPAPEHADGPVDDGRMNFTPERTREEAEMDMTPMVDVTFLLLIFFMITAAFSIQKSLQIPKPTQTDEPSTKPLEDQDENPDIVTVLVDSSNVFHVITPDDEKECPSEQELLIQLRESRKPGGGTLPPSTLIVKANMESRHDKVVMALDAGTQVGFDTVQLMSTEEDF